MHVARLYIFLVFMSVFGILPILEIHRGMWPGYIFYSFSWAFLAFCPFSKCTNACGPVIHFLVFVSVFGIWPIFEMHKCMWPGYTFSRFRERFWHLAHFRNAQRHVARLCMLSFSWAFFCICWFQIVFSILPIFEMHKRMWSGYTFYSFHERFWHLAHFRNTQRHVARLYFFSFSWAFFCICWFQIVFSILPIFEMHKRMWSGYTFFSFHERFWHLAHFRNAQRHVARLCMLSFSWAFFCICWFQIVFGILPIFEMHKRMWSSYTFYSFHERFWHLAHFRNTQKDVVQLYILLVSWAFLVFYPFSKCTKACGPVIHFSRFMSVFGIWPIFEIHRGMWPGYIFSRFPERFFAFVGFKSFLVFYPFSKCTKGCGPVIHFTRFVSVFGIWPIFEIHRGMWSGHIFSRFMRDLTKVIKVNFRSVVQLK